MTYEEVKTKVRTAVEDYFKLQLGRPEILNRIGENIVVFDFIRPDVAKLILQSQIEKIRKNLAIDKQITFSLSEKILSLFSSFFLTSGTSSRPRVIFVVLITLAFLNTIEVSISFLR